MSYTSRSLTARPLKNSLSYWVPGHFSGAELLNVGRGRDFDRCSHVFQGMCVVTSCHIHTDAEASVADAALESSDLSQKNASWNPGMVTISMGSKISGSYKPQGKTTNVF